MIYWFTGQPGAGKTTLAEAFIRNCWKPSFEASILFSRTSSSLVTTFLFIVKMRDLIVLLCVWGLFPVKPIKMIVKSWFTALKLTLIIEQTSENTSCARPLILRLLFVIELMSSMM